MNFKKREDGGLEAEFFHRNSGEIPKLITFSISKENVDVLREVIAGSKNIGDEEKETLREIDLWYLQNVTPTKSNLHLREYIAKRLGSKELDTKNQQPKDFLEDLGALVDKMEQSAPMAKKQKQMDDINILIGMTTNLAVIDEPFFAGNGIIKDPVVRKECLHLSAVSISGTDPNYPVLWCEDCGAIRYKFAFDNNWKLPVNPKDGKG
jgi:hypothetical protein